VEFEIVFHSVDVRFQSVSRFKVCVSLSVVYCINKTPGSDRTSQCYTEIFNWTLDYPSLEAVSICSFTLLKMKLIYHS
jgi:hypothetical protein